MKYDVERWVEIKSNGKIYLVKISLLIVSFTAVSWVNLEVGSKNRLTAWMDSLYELTVFWKISSLTLPSLFVSSS